MPHIHAVDGNEENDENNDHAAADDDNDGGKIYMLNIAGQSFFAPDVFICNCQELCLADDICLLENSY